MAIRPTAVHAEQSPFPAHCVTTVKAGHEFFGTQTFRVRHPVKGLRVPGTLEERQSLGTWLAENGVAATIRANRYAGSAVDYMADLHVAPGPSAAQNVWDVLGAVAVVPGLVERTPDMLWHSLLRPICTVIGLHLLIPIIPAIEGRQAQLFALGGTLSIAALYNVVGTWHARRVERRTATEFFSVRFQVNGAPLFAAIHGRYGFSEALSTRMFLNMDHPLGEAVHALWRGPLRASLIRFGELPAYLPRGSHFLALVAGEIPLIPKH